MGFLAWRGNNAIDDWSAAFVKTRPTSLLLSAAKELTEIKISDFTSLFDPSFFFDPRFLLYLPSKSPNKDETRTIRKPLL